MMNKFWGMMVFIGVIVAQVDAQPVKKLRVMTYNILNGFDYGKDSVREQLTADFIASHHPDVVALQELCGFTEAKLKAFAKKWGHSYVAILKEEGYPVGLTSSEPIVVKKKQTQDLWHGMLHGSTHGVDFLVVHLSPADHEFRRREARWITSYMNQFLTDQNNYILLGDFNAHSPFDSYLDKTRPMLLKRYQNNDAKSKNKNLDDNRFDYSVISEFLSHPLIDVCEQMVNPEALFSFPTPILIGKWRKKGEIVPTRERIDYILVSPTMASFCTDAKIINSGIVDQLSDHFPIIANFEN